MTIVGRSKIDHPALGTAGGSALHASIETIYTNIGDDLAGRFDTASSIANSTVTTIDHNFGVDFADLRVLIYTGTHPNLTRVSDPVASGWTIAATSGFEKTKVDITTPSSGGPHTFAVFITQGKEVNASTTAGGIVSTGTQTFAGAKTWNDAQTFKANSGADIAGSYDTSYQWTLGRSTSNDALVHTIYGSAMLGTAIPSFSSTAYRYLGNKFNSAYIRLDSTSGSSGFTIRVGQYFDGTTTKRSVANQTSGFLAMNSRAAAGTWFQVNVDSSIAGAADSTASNAQVLGIGTDGSYEIGPTAGLVDHKIYGGLIGSRLGTTSASFPIAAGSGLRLGSNIWLESSSNSWKAINTSTGYSQVATQHGSSATSSILTITSNYQDAQTAGSAIVTTNERTIWLQNAIGAVTAGSSLGLGTGAGAYHTVYGAIVGYSASAASRWSIGHPDAMALTANLYRDGSNAMKAISTVTGYTHVVATRATSGTTSVFDIFSNYQDAQTADSAQVTTNQLAILSVTAQGAFTFAPSGSTTNLEHKFYGKTVTVTADAQNTADASVFKLSVAGVQKARMYATNTAGLTFENAATVIGSYDSAGAWIFGATNSTASHLMYCTKLSLQSSATTASVFIQFNALGTGNGYIGAEGSGAGKIITNASNGDISICANASGIAFSANNGTTLQARLSSSGTFVIGPTSGNGIYLNVQRLFRTVQTSTISRSADMTSTQLTTSNVNSSKIQITGSGAYNIHGLAALDEGTCVFIFNNTDATLTIKQDSGTEGTAANRIRTRTGADVTFPTNTTALLIYGSDRWQLIGGG